MLKKMEILSLEPINHKNNIQELEDVNIKKPLLKINLFSPHDTKQHHSSKDESTPLSFPSSNEHIRSLTSLSSVTKNIYTCPDTSSSSNTTNNYKTCSLFTSHQSDMTLPILPKKKFYSKMSLLIKTINEKTAHTKEESIDGLIELANRGINKYGRGTDPVARTLIRNLMKFKIFKKTKTIITTDLRNCFETLKKKSEDNKEDTGNIKLPTSTYGRKFIVIGNGNNENENFISSEIEESIAKYSESFFILVTGDKDRKQKFIKQINARWPGRYEKNLFVYEKGDNMENVISNLLESLLKLEHGSLLLEKLSIEGIV